jgi:hypothetical protein
MDSESFAAGVSDCDCPMRAWSGENDDNAESVRDTNLRQSAADTISAPQLLAPCAPTCATSSNLPSILLAFQLHALNMPRLVAEYSMNLVWPDEVDADADTGEGDGSSVQLEFAADDGRADRASEVNSPPTAVREPDLEEEGESRYCKTCVQRGRPSPEEEEEEEEERSQIFRAGGEGRERERKRESRRTT